MSDTTFDFGDGWFSPDEFANLRRRLPITYVNAIPVRLGSDGSVQQIGLLLRSDETGTLGRELVAGRVNYHETVRAALIRHAESDLGSMALPQVPASIQPFTIAEYFPTPGVGLHDPRQHAIALCYILPVQGDCSPRTDALSLDWLTPEETMRADITAELGPDRTQILKQGLAHLGLLH